MLSSTSSVCENASGRIMRSRSDSPSSHSITKKLRPSGSVPKPNTSTMFG